MTITLPQLIEQFCATKQVEGKTLKTVKWYKETLHRYIVYSTNGHELTLADLNLENARAYVASLQQQQVRWKGHPQGREKEGPLSAFTIHGYIRSLKVFSVWLNEEGYTSQDVLSRLKKPKLPQLIIEVLTDEEINRIMSIVNPNCFLGARLNLIILLLLDTGIRASELCGMKLADVNILQGTFKVLGKGNKERIVPFGATAKKALLRYTTTWRPEPVNPQVDTLILSTDGRELTYWGLMHIIRRLSVTANIERLHAHLFRHSFAVRYLVNGGDIMTLRLILGHTSLQVTQIYLHLTDQHIKLAHDRFSPVDRLGIKPKRRG